MNDAPPLCTLLAAHTTVRVPFLYGAATILVSAVVITARRPALWRADVRDEDRETEAENVTLGEESMA